jgi:hypothetical protein
MFICSKLFISNITVSEFSLNIPLICIKLIIGIVKTLLSLTLLFALLLKMGGFYAILSFEREEIREKVERKLLNSIQKSELICIVENAENLSKIEWERSEREFSFEGNLYDVVYKETIAGVNHFYCLSDDDETKLEAKIDKLLETQNNHSSSGNHSKLILDFLSEPLIFSQNPLFYFQYFIDKKPSISSNLAILFLSDYVSKLKQPPQFS